MLRAAGDRKYALTLLAVAAAVLAIGILVRSARTAQKAAPVDLERLQQMTEQRRLTDLSRYLTNAANGVASSIVYLDGPGTSGLVWGSRDEVLTPRRAAVPFSIVAAKDPAAVIPAYRATVPPAPGEWVLAVAKNRDQRIVFAHGLYQGHGAARCGSFAYDEVQSSAPLSNALTGGGLFTIQGQLLGFIAACGERATVIAASTIGDVLSRPVTLNDQLEAGYGMRVNASGEDVQVAAVWGRSAADSAGLQPGDLVRAVDGAKVGSAADLGKLAAEPAEAHELDVERGARKLTMRLLPAQLQDSPAAATLAGLTLGAGVTERDVAVVAVSPDSPAQRAGILPGDILRRVGPDAVVDRAVAGHALDSRAGRPVVLGLERDGREIEVLLAP